MVVFCKKLKFADTFPVEPLKEIIKDNIDILLGWETKSDDTFPVGRFCVDGYSTPYRLDRTWHGGGILLYIRKDIALKILKFEPVQNNFKGFFVEINLSKKKWPLFC